MERERHQDAAPPATRPPTRSRTRCRSAVSSRQPDGATEPTTWSTSPPPPRRAVSVSRFGHIANTLALDMRISAGETMGKVKILSNPKVLVIQNERAVINLGSQLPGPEDRLRRQPRRVEWKDVGIKLDVTPQVTNDKRIFMEIKVEKSTQGENVLTTEGTMFSINTRRARDQGPDRRRRDDRHRRDLRRGDIECRAIRSPGFRRSRFSAGCSRTHVDRREAKRADDLHHSADRRDVGRRGRQRGQWTMHPPRAGALSFWEGYPWSGGTTRRASRTGPRCWRFSRGCPRGSCSAPGTSIPNLRAGSSATAAAPAWRSRRTTPSSSAACVSAARRAPRSRCW